MKFVLEASPSGTRARAGRLSLNYSEVLTPLFMPVGTLASVRNVSSQELNSTGSQILLANTYHLMLRPGKDYFDKCGGVHSFMDWPKGVLTDSGGYQVFSLSQTRRITEEGVHFKSYIDGSDHLLSPEHSISMQRSIGSDIMMAMDLCIPSTEDFSETKKAMDQTHRWAVRSLKAREGSAQALFGIIQGACHESLRKESAKFISSLPFEGLAIGGLAVGETKEERERFTEVVTAELEANRPRYLMGVGTPLDLLEAVHRGVDMFDCIIPTQLAEQGVVYTSEGRVQLSRGVYRYSQEALDKNCDCYACKNHSRAYLHHLVKSCEPLCTQLLGAHNIRFYHLFMQKMRASILAGDFLSFYKEWQERLSLRDTTYVKELTPKLGRRPDRRPRQMGIFELHEVEGSKLASIKHSQSQEVMHPGLDPMSESKLLYVEQSKIKEKLCALEKNQELVLWDVGLGAAFNAMAVLHELEGIEFVGKLRIQSFERDLDPLRLALCHPAKFPYLCHKAPHALIENNIYESAQITWQLLEGDFRDTYPEAKSPDIIYFDPFSYKTDSELWSLEFFDSLYKKLQSSFVKEKNKENILFLNYTTSSLLRSRLLMAGFYVARGRAAPPKKETTMAFLNKPEQEDVEKLLDKEFLEKLQRTERWEQGFTKEAYFKSVLAHPQFIEYKAFYEA